MLLAKMSEHLVASEGSKMLECPVVQRVCFPVILARCWQDYQDWSSAKYIRSAPGLPPLGRGGGGLCASQGLCSGVVHRLPFRGNVEHSTFLEAIYRKSKEARRATAALEELGFPTTRFAAPRGAGGRGCA